MSNIFIGLGAVNAFISVCMGAFAAHKLKATLSTEYLSVIHTAADYQFYHALGLILIGLIYQQNKARPNIISGWFMFSGILLFSGSLYLLGLSGIKWLGMITPLGGVCFLIAWVILAYAHLRPSSNN